MRTQKRFTPALLERFQREGRGTSTYHDYIPWHRVGRGDPASLGRSHLEIWKCRQRELLSDVELTTLHFATMLPEITDIREQFPLRLDFGQHEGLDYDVRFGDSKQFPGTEEIAQNLRIKHPLVREGTSSVFWRMTTDLLIAQRAANQQIRLLAVACKPSSNGLTKRTREKLTIEREYWIARSVPWLLITPDQYDESVGLTLRRSEPWTLHQQSTDAEINLARKIAFGMRGHTFADTIDGLSKQLGCQNRALRAFWQSVWRGVVPLDLRRGWRPHLPIELLTPSEFGALNPLLAGRTAWN